MARVRVKNLTKKFGNTVAVNNVIFEAKDKEFLTLLGPSGCGKTTILRCIAGLETPDEGQIYIGDEAVNDLPPRDRNVAMVFQSYALYPHMSVFDNLAFPLKMHKVPKNDVEKRVKEIANFLRIDHLLRRMPKQLSGGEAQRVALGRAIVRRPKAFLLDEPLSNLDAKLRVYMRVELKKLHEELQATIIYVTHDQIEAMTLSDRIVVMDKGTIQVMDKPSNIYNRPSNLFTASFIGSPPMNFIDCTFIEKNGNAFIDLGPYSLRISDTLKDLIKQQATSSELILGIRPEDVMLHKKQASAECIEGKIYVVEPLGSEIIYDLRVGKEILLKVRTPPHFSFDASTKVWLSFNMDKMHIFDKKTEKVIV